VFDDVTAASDRQISARMAALAPAFCAESAFATRPEDFARVSAAMLWTTIPSRYTVLQYPEQDMKLDREINKRAGQRELSGTCQEIRKSVISHREWCWAAAQP
jgi:hypothetical protein